jgi:lysophospholipase L1-like esterase
VTSLGHADLKVKDRVAAVSPQGILVSTDAGTTWREMSRALPYRHSRNVVCFAGEQVVVGTGGNGVFYAPISSLQGAATSRARTTVTSTQYNAALRSKATTQDSLPAAVTALPLKVAASDRNIRYVGRFDVSDSAGPRAAWSASTVALKFRGTSLNVRMKDSPSNRWQVEVDGVPTTTLQMIEGEHTYRVAEGLPVGEHSVRLVKATEALFGTSQILGLELSQGGRLLPLVTSARHLEVIGDSISAGYGNEAASKEEKFSHKTQNAYFTYGAIAARQLGADYTCVAWSGKKMWPNNTVPELYDRVLPNEAESTWNFAKQVPNAVLINLATNDFGAGIPDEAGWTGAYKAFIARVRRNYPQAHIYCAIGPMMGDWGEGKPLTTLRSYLSKTVTDVRATGDTKVHLIDFGTQDAKNGFGADWHPNIKTNQLMAEQLVQTLRKDLNW